KGFKDFGSNTNIVFNGTFFSNSYFPGIGYNPGVELVEDDDRRREGLPVKERMREADDLSAKQVNAFGDDADRIRLEIVVGTERDQIAIAPGALRKEWVEGDRKYFQYKTDRPIANAYSIVSGRYAVRRDKWRDVELEIYYRPGHEYNLDRMMDAMKDGLQYNTENFSAYQFRQLRIVEFPRYETFAPSFANTIPFSEGVGFILKVANPAKDLDVPYYLTLHEVAHQWWGHQVMAADVKGSAMLSESMCQYSAMMVMKKKFPPEIVERYLKYELDSYLSGRASERKKEQPLQSVEAQTYIDYNKASLVFYTLQDYIGEEKLNSAFRKYNEMWRFKDAPYPGSLDLLTNIREVTPDSLQYLIHDLFETITLFENKAERAVYTQTADGQFELTLSVTCEKIRSDSLGNEVFATLNDWIDVGVYSRDDKGNDKLVYLQKRKIAAKDNAFVITLGERPAKAGIDPLHKLIDRHSGDNTVAATEIIDIANIPLGN
ncbi:MAG TPA: M1 family aminopeptidase, partial [Chryseosolibacter sp.]